MSWVVPGSGTSAEAGAVSDGGYLCSEAGVWSERAEGSEFVPEGASD